jgi:hypothetical protein
MRKYHDGEKELIPRFLDSHIFTLFPYEKGLTLSEWLYFSLEPERLDGNYSYWVFKRSSIIDQY